MESQASQEMRAGRNTQMRGERGQETQGLAEIISPGIDGNTHTACFWATAGAGRR